MQKWPTRWPLLAVFVLVFNVPAHAVERADVPEKYRWDLSSLYASEAAWTADKDELVKAISTLGELQGKMGVSAASLLAGMTAWEKTNLQAERLYAYALQTYDQDTRVLSVRSSPAVPR